MARRRYQKGSIRKRGRRNPVWELQWREDYIESNGRIGRRVVTRIIGPAQGMTLRQARKAADEILRPLNLGRVRPESTMTLAEFVERYFIPNALPTLKISTQQRYRQTIKAHLLPAFGSTRLCDLGTIEIQSFVLSKMASGLGWASVDHYRNLLSKIFSSAKKWGFYAGENPATDVVLPEHVPVREKHVVAPEQIAPLLASLPEPVRTMVELGLLTGMRVGEILALRWESVDFHSGLIRVEQNYYRGHTGTPKTKGSRRTVPLPSKLSDSLQHLRESSGTSPLVFSTRKGTPFSDTNLLHRHLKPAGKGLGMPWLNWHTLRRTHATLFQLAGGSLREAQAQLGHSRMSTTLEIYTVPMPASQRAAVEKLSVLMANDGELATTRTLGPQQIQ